MFNQQSTNQPSEQSMQSQPFSQSQSGAQSPIPPEIQGQGQQGAQGQQGQTQGQSGMPSPIPPEIQGQGQQDQTQGQLQGPGQMQGAQSQPGIQSAQGQQGQMQGQPPSPPQVQGMQGQQGSQAQGGAQQLTAQSQQATGEAQEAGEGQVSAQAAANLWTYGKYVYVGAGAAVWDHLDTSTSYPVFSVALTPYSTGGYFRVDEVRHWKYSNTAQRNYALIRNFGSAGYVYVRYLYGY